MDTNTKWVRYSTFMDLYMYLYSIFEARTTTRSESLQSCNREAGWRSFLPQSAPGDIDIQSHKARKVSKIYLSKTVKYIGSWLISEWIQRIVTDTCGLDIYIYINDTSTSPFMQKCFLFTLSELSACFVEVRSAVIVIVKEKSKIYAYYASHVALFTKDGARRSAN